MDRRSFLRTLLMMPLLKFPNFLGKWDTAYMFPTRVDVDYITSLNGHWDYAWTDTELNSKAGRVNLEVQHLPTKDMLWFCVDGDHICVGEMLPDVVVSWEVEPRPPHTVCYEGTPLFEVPADGQKHLIAIAWENGHPVKAYLDGDAVWFSDVRLYGDAISFPLWGTDWKEGR